MSTESKSDARSEPTTLEGGRVATEMIRHFRRKVAACRTVPRDALSGDTAAVTVNCLQVVATILDGHGAPTGRQVAQLEAAAAQWARAGVPVEAVLHALHEGSKMAHALVAAQSEGDERAECIQIGARTVDLLNVVTSTVTQAYLREYSDAGDEPQHAAQALTSALLAGRPTTGIARECGIDVAPAYYVVAASLPRQTQEADAVLDCRVAARRRLRRVRSELTAHCGKRCLSRMSVAGGTILIPLDSTSEDRLAQLFRHLSDAVAAPVTAAFVEAACEDIPEVVSPLHEMVDIADRLRIALHAEPRARLYRFDELAAEYQLTRPGPVRDSLARKIEPLGGYPELLETLRVYLVCDQSRQRTARRLHLHPNTVDYRLKRIATVTGMDPIRAEGQWRLRSALIAGVGPGTPAVPGEDPGVRA
ncbi:putative transcriptional regulator [Nocardia nova SH22a]|uniref:Putative transcriptional regulator n=1 Tax=Nocardia nova SH22a TaxID=1415166 RepID=W5TL83_9NOCA|nr:helix-turn-helix domain-containing protein [Nocardia nova]AHH19728.1 putative transcriptional regulator [Nocardia nova SH22a]